MKFNPNSADLTPRETALVVAAEGLNLKLRSRAHLLAVIDALDFSKESVESRMAYAMALMSLGFSTPRATKRLGLSRSQVRDWKSRGDNRRKFLESQSRGELMLEETVLLAAERDPQWAQSVLLARDKERDDEPPTETVYDATHFLKKSKLKKDDPLE